MILKYIIKLQIENRALRSQLSIVQEKIVNKKIKRPRVSRFFRIFWVLMSKYYKDWKSLLVIVKPETVVGWHKKAFKMFWRFKSRKRGRPKISPQTIALIKRIHKEYPLLSPEKIHERLVDLAVTDVPCANTITKYIKGNERPPSDKQKQSWKTFLKNHAAEIWAMDFFVVPTLTFRIMFVVIVMSHDRRKIEHIAVTSNPNLFWTIQQIREATAFNNQPKFLIHDNDPVFVSERFKTFLSNSNIKDVKTSVQAPNMNAICERTIGILRRELLGFIVPLNERHLNRLLCEYVEYYNHDRTHQGINCETPALKDISPETTMKDTKLISTPILNGLHYRYKKAA